jgi:mannosyl-oligosaccharide glucosidase
MLLDHLLDRFEADPALKEREFDRFKVFLADIYDNFKLNVEWFLRTQASTVIPNTFRWAGRTETYCLPSGMDDYPRAPILTDQEAHLDL